MRKWILAFMLVVSIGAGLFGGINDSGSISYSGGITTYENGVGG